MVFYNTTVYIWVYIVKQLIYCAYKRRQMGKRDWPNIWFNTFIDFFHTNT